MRVAHAPRAAHEGEDEGKEGLHATCGGPLLLHVDIRNRYYLVTSLAHEKIDNFNINVSKQIYVRLIHRFQLTDFVQCIQIKYKETEQITKEMMKRMMKPMAK